MDKLVTAWSKMNNVTLSPVTVLVWILVTLSHSSLGQLTTDSNQLNVISALVRYSYIEPVSGVHVHGQGELGRYATNSPVHPVSGQLVHVQDEQGQNHGCSSSTPINVPSGEWIALIERGICTFEEKVINAAVNNNASAVIIYNKIEESELLTMMHSVDHVVSIFIHKKDGELLADLVDSGTTVEIDISIGQITMYEIIPSSDYKPSILLVISLTLIAFLIVGLGLLLYFAIRKTKRKKQNSRKNIVFTLHKPGQVHESLLSDLQEATEHSHRSSSHHSNIV